MCGIVGVIGNNVKDTIINSLKKLEYRGYDSSGIAIKQDKTIAISKSIGNISELINNIKDFDDGNIGIGHTRWATHGKPSLNNAHPHTSSNNQWAIVHNGIIENSSFLRTKLHIAGYQFYGETDTEVIAKILEDSKYKMPLHIITNATKCLQGSYALAILNNEHNQIYATKRFCPLYIAMTKDGAIIASDLIVFDGIADSYYSLDDNDVAIVSKSRVTFYNNNIKIKKRKFPLSLITNQPTKICQHHMQCEINETLDRIKDTITNYSTPKLNKETKEVLLIGCGSAYHAGLMGARYLQTICNINARCYIASEFRYGHYSINPDALYIFISQSGETADTLASIDIVKNIAPTLAITNVPYSSIVNRCDTTIHLHAGFEISVASTKAYSCMLASLLTLCFDIVGIDNNKILSSLNMVKLEQYNYTSLIKRIINSNTLLFIGRDNDYITALETSLKFRELCYINTFALPAGELKHGSLALIDKNSLVVVICTIENLINKVVNSISEIKARGGQVVVFSQFEQSLFGNIDDYYQLPTTTKNLQHIINITPLHQLAYDTCISLGNNPDQPRNLAKSVTVE